MMKNQTRRQAAELYDREAHLCKSLGHSTRIQIIDLLAKGELRAAALQTLLAISKANLSQHLAILRGAGLVTTRRDGRHVYYSLAAPQVKKTYGLVRELIRLQLNHGRRLIASQ
jgi:ArsR family transcriptional regulator